MEVNPCLILILIFIVTKAVQSEKNKIVPKLMETTEKINSHNDITDQCYLCTQSIMNEIRSKNITHSVEGDVTKQTDKNTIYTLLIANV